VNLEKEMCGYDAGYLKGKVILWVDTGDILCFMIQHFKARNSSKNEENMQVLFTALAPTDVQI